MTGIRQICVDMDGVLCDFMGAAIRLFNQTTELVYQNWPRGEYETAVRLGVTEQELWDAIHARGEEYWFEMEPYPWAQDLLEHCNKLAPTIILSSPSKHASSLAGKWRWIEKHLPDYSRKFLIGPRKEFCAKEGCVLIDDYDYNCNVFQSQGGWSIAFPRIWNRNHQNSEQPIAYVKDLLHFMSLRTYR